MDRQKILFICGHYASPRFANSICVKNLTEEFCRMGCEVWVVGMNDTDVQKSEDKNGVHTILLPEPFLTRANNDNTKTNLLKNIYRGLLRFLHSVYSVFFYPNVDYPKSSVLFQVTSQIIREEGINTVVATYKPYSTIHCAIKLKKQFQAIRVVTYHLDLIMSPHNSSQIIRKYKNALASSKLGKELSVVDKTLLPSSAVYLVSDKVSYVDFPLYIPTKEIESTTRVDAFSENTVNIAYVGSMDDINRNPSFIFRIIKQLPRLDGKMVVLHIWGGISESILKETDSIKVLYRGVAQPDEVPGILDGADFILSIGNKITYKMIPSKIFQMFAAKKPVIFLKKHEDDKSARYYQDYGTVCVIKEYRISNEQAVALLSDFMGYYYKRNVMVSDKVFEKSTPSYICNEILG